MRITPVDPIFFSLAGLKTDQDIDHDRVRLNSKIDKLLQASKSYARPSFNPGPYKFAWFSCRPLGSPRSRSRRPSHLSRTAPYALIERDLILTRFYFR